MKGDINDVVIGWIYRAAPAVAVALVVALVAIGVIIAKLL